MTVGWLNLSGSWYYMDEEEGGNNGRMVTGWKLVKGKWYYLSSDNGADNGKMLSDTIVDGYKVGADGAWIN